MLCFVYTTRFSFQGTVFVRSELLRWADDMSKPWTLMGMEDGLWDLDALSKVYKFEFESEACCANTKLESPCRFLSAVDLRIYF